MPIDDHSIDNAPGESQATSETIVTSTPAQPQTVDAVVSEFVTKSNILEEIEKNCNATQEQLDKNEPHEMKTDNTVDVMDVTTQWGSENAATPPNAITEIIATEAATTPIPIQTTTIKEVNTVTEKNDLTTAVPGNASTTVKYSINLIVSFVFIFVVSSGLHDV